MKIWLMQLFLLVILAMTVNANWQSKNDVIYHEDCDFHDPIFATFRIELGSLQDCAKLCSDDPKCKYFVARKDLTGRPKCWLKDGPNVLAVNPSATCGFVANRF